MSDRHINLLHYQLGNGVRAFSTTRQGGVGEGVYGGFNITHYCNDKPENVRRNRALLCEELGISDNRLLLPRQIHGTRLFPIDRAFLSFSAEEQTRQLDGADAIMTDVPGICIGVSTADCIPVLLYDHRNKAIAAVHAGWRGTVGKIIETTICGMTSAYGTEPARLHAVIGPGISEAAFEVGEEVYQAFLDAGFPMQEIARKYPAREDWKWHIDLWAANYHTLESCGLDMRNIQVAGICTYTESQRFFSARRLGIDSGRIFNGIMLTE